MQSIIFINITLTCASNPFRILSITISIYMKITRGDKILTYFAISNLLKSNKLRLSEKINNKIAIILEKITVNVNIIVDKNLIFFSFFLIDY